MAPPFGIGLGPVGSPYLLDIDFTLFPTGAATLPAPFTFARALSSQSLSETVQTSDQTLVTSGLTANVPRIGQRTASQSVRGLVIEEERTNQFQANRGFTKFVADGSAIAPVTTGGPYTAADGASLVTNRLTVSSGGYGRYQTAALLAIFSVWIRSGSSSSSSQIFVGDGGISSKAQGGTVDATWRRVLLPPPNGVSSEVLEACDARDWHTLAPGGVVAGARDVVADLMQGEYTQTQNASGAASEVILTPAAASNTRFGERFGISTGALVVDTGGIVNFYFAMSPKCASASSRTLTSAKTRFLTIDANNYVEHSQATSNVTFVTAGASLALPTTATWSQFDFVEFFLTVGGGVPATGKYRKNGGATIDLGSTSGNTTALAPAGAMDLFCDGTDKQMNAWLHHLTFYRNGNRPSWA